MASEHGKCDDCERTGVMLFGDGHSGRCGRCLLARVGELEGNLRAADAMAEKVDDLVKANKINSRSPLADARLDYGQPFEYKHTKR